MANSARISWKFIPFCLQSLEGHLLDFAPRLNLSGLRRFALEFLYFGIKQARACLFVVLFFAAVFSFPRSGVWGIPRYDALLIIASAIQAWRLLDVRIRHHPPYWMAGLNAAVIYANFFTHHYIGDYRWYIAACTLGLYARSTVIFRPLDRERSMPLLLSFVLIGFFIWLAENISTFFGVWRYPNQMGAWAVVHLGKWSSWSLLAIMTFTIVANLKHIKSRIHVPP
jgi:uncharacterized membrane protein YoaT (DUF817 family)